MTYGVARGMHNFIDQALGTGVGSGIVINGISIRSHGNAGELGYMMIRRNGRGLWQERVPRGLPPMSSTDGR